MGITAADWEVIEGNPGSNSKQTGIARTRLGGYSADTAIQHGEVNAYAVTLAPTDAATNTFPTIALGGAGTAGLVLVRFTARQVFNGPASITVEGHLHAGDNAAAGHAATPAAVTVPALVLGSGILAAVCLSALQADMQSVDLTIDSEHYDKWGREGEFLCGATTGFKQTCVVELVDDGADPTLATGWLRDSRDIITKNNDFYMRTIRASKYTVA
jgi:hypothetical protein